MKGSLHTGEVMSAVVRRDGGLRTGRRVSHVFIIDPPARHTPLLVTDAAINLSPTLEDKVGVVADALDLARVLGVEVAKVAMLSAVETVTSKISSTIEAAAPCKMHIISKVAGDADILPVPGVEAGNMLAKQLRFLDKVEAAGIVLDARVILTGRAGSIPIRTAICAVAALLADARRTATAEAAAIVHEDLSKLKG